MKDKNIPKIENHEKSSPIFCTAVVTDQKTLKVDPSLFAHVKLGAKLKVTIYLPDKENPAI